MSAENMNCGDCGMLVEPANAFHPGAYCQLFKAGVTNTALWFESVHFMPDPSFWGDDAPARQRHASRTSRVLNT
jgi:hypothetical protein